MTLSLANLTIRKKEGEVLFSDCSFNVKQGEILTLMAQVVVENPRYLTSLQVICRQSLSTKDKFYSKTNVSTC